MKWIPEQKENYQSRIRNENILKKIIILCIQYIFFMSGCCGLEYIVDNKM